MGYFLERAREHLTDLMDRGRTYSAYNYLCNVWYDSTFKVLFREKKLDPHFVFSDGEEGSEGVDLFSELTNWHKFSRALFLLEEMGLDVYRCKGSSISWALSSLNEDLACATVRALEADPEKFRALVELSVQKRYLAKKVETAVDWLRDANKAGATHQHFAEECLVRLDAEDDVAEHEEHEEPPQDSTTAVAVHQASHGPSSLSQPDSDESKKNGDGDAGTVKVDDVLVGDLQPMPVSSQPYQRTVAVR